MNKFTTHAGKAVALYQPNIDTDQIIPKQFLKRIERTGFGAFLFYDWRFKADGAPREDFVLNDPKYKDASILIAGANFGCGSSREHAPWALDDFGFRAILAPSFADIFYNNCFKIGILPVRLTGSQIGRLVENFETQEDYRLTVNLEAQTVSDGANFHVGFEVEEFRRTCLLKGLDDIGLTLQHESEIAAYESAAKKINNGSVNLTNSVGK